MKLESVLQLMIITLVIPVLSETIFTPVLSKYFLSEADVAVSIFGFFLDTFVLHNFKRILKEELSDQKL